MRRNEEQGAEKDDKGIAMTKKPALFSVGYMESDWIRYAIEDERGRYWTGRGFSKDERKALAYADENVIARGMRRILKRRCKGLVRYRFVAPVMIDVYAEGPIDQEETAWFLSQHCFVSMDGPRTGVGPGGSVVLPPSLPGNRFTASTFSSVLGSSSLALVLASSSLALVVEFSLAQMLASSSLAQVLVSVSLAPPSHLQQD